MLQNLANRSFISFIVWFVFFFLATKRLYSCLLYAIGAIQMTVKKGKQNTSVLSTQKLPKNLDFLCLLWSHQWSEVQRPGVKTSQEIRNRHVDIVAVGASSKNWPLQTTKVIRMLPFKAVVVIIAIAVERIWKHQKGRIDIH